MQIAYFCIGALGLLQMALAMHVSMLRGKTRTIVGGGTDPTDPLYKARIAHSNACEFIPILALLMLCLQMAGTANAMVWVFGLATSARYLHAAGILLYPTMAQPNAARFLGALLTYVCGFLMAGSLLYGTLARH